MKRKHKLLTKALEEKLPVLGATDGADHDKIKVPVKFFSPYSNWTWYALEYSPGDQTFFGLVHGFEKEFGYFSLAELESTKLSIAGARVPAVERDLYWNSDTTLDDVEKGRAR